MDKLDKCYVCKKIGIKLQWVFVPRTNIAPGDMPIADIKSICDSCYDKQIKLLDAIFPDNK